MRSVSLLLAVLVSGLGGCSVNPATGRTQLILISPHQVLAMGAAAAPEVVERHGGEIESPQLRTYVDRVGQGLARQTEIEFRDAYDWTFTIVDSDEINAFALPGGRVFLSRGLLQRFTNEAQVAAVLGHEIGHITARHVDERLSQVVLAQLGLGYLGEATDSQLALVVVSMVTQGTLLRFSRDQEAEADEQGLKYMAGAGYDPDAMLEVLRILAEASTDPRPPEFLSTHPHPQSRLRTVSRLLAGPYRHTRDNPAFRKHQRRFEEEAAPFLSLPGLASRPRH